MEDKINKREIVIYKSKDGGIKVEAEVKNETVWLKQEQIANIFDTDRSVITKHLKNIFDSGELSEKSNVQKTHIANSDKPVKFYSLDVILSVGYRVNSKRATQFRIWATGILKSHILNGFTLNQKRLSEIKGKQPIRNLPSSVMVMSSFVMPLSRATYAFSWKFIATSLRHS